jgi:hypothetical protein
VLEAGVLELEYESLGRPHQVEREAEEVPVVARGASGCITNSEKKLLLQIVCPSSWGKSKRNCVGSLVIRCHSALTFSKVIIWMPGQDGGERATAK